MGSYFMTGELLSLIFIVGCCEAVIVGTRKHWKGENHHDEPSSIAGTPVGEVV